MQHWRDLSDVPADNPGTVVTIGNFDGVHLGHQAVLRALARDAAAQQLLSVAVTFSPHPAQVHRPDDAPALICDENERLARLADVGIDAVLTIEYTLQFADQTAEEFVRTYLVNGLRVRQVVIGRDVRFGRGNAGDLTTMIELGDRYGFEVHVIDDIGTDDQERFSSTRIRKFIEAGNVRDAGELLGRPHLVSGIVVHGDKRGRELGFPTANLQPAPDGLVPADGVYAGWLRRPALQEADDPDAVLPAAISVGTNPTFDGVQRRVEAYVLDRTDLELYGEHVVMEFVHLLRPTLRFDSIDDLVTQMRADVANTRVELGLERVAPKDAEVSGD